jgi:hypothetical protein
MSRKLRISMLVLAALVSVGLLGLASVSLAEQNEKAGESVSQERPPKVGKLRRGIERRLMRGSFDLYHDGRVVKVQIDRGKLVAAREDSIEVEYADASKGDIALQGEVRVCHAGDPGAKLGDLEPGKPVGVHRISNHPKGDFTIVLQVSGRGELKKCKGVLEGILPTAE